MRIYIYMYIYIYKYIYNPYVNKVWFICCIDIKQYQNIDFSNIYPIRTQMFRHMYVFNHNIDVLPHVPNQNIDFPYITPARTQMFHHMSPVRTYISISLSFCHVDVWKVQSYKEEWFVLLQLVILPLITLQLSVLNSYGGIGSCTPLYSNISSYAFQRLKKC